MDRRKQIKQELGERYVFERLLSVREAKNLLRQDAKKISPQVVQSLTAGCVKIELCVYAQNGKSCLGYDVFVKDSPDSPEWICFDSPNVPGSFDEEKMFDVLDRVVKDNHLSYTECCFEKLHGKRIEKKTAKAPPATVTACEPPCRPVRRFCGRGGTENTRTAKTGKFALV